MGGIGVCYFLEGRWVKLCEWLGVVYFCWGRLYFI